MRVSIYNGFMMRRSDIIKELIQLVGLGGTAYVVSHKVAQLVGILKNRRHSY